MTTVSCLFISYSLLAHNVKSSTNQLSLFAHADNYSNILSVKQLIDDNWQYQPNNSASNAFSQSEWGIKGQWQQLTFSASQRVDYFVQTSPATAAAYFMLKNKQALVPAQTNDIRLKLLHQQSNGIRVGYLWQLDDFSTEVSLGYWQTTANRKSEIVGKLSSDANGDVSSEAFLTEFYSKQNFLKRQNNDQWNTQGKGFTVDLNAHWQITNKIDLLVEWQDIYSRFNVANNGYSEGEINTQGTFINSVGGVAYLPLYRGKEITRDNRFSMPSKLNVELQYQTKAFNYLLRFKQQGYVDFYYIGSEWRTEKTKLRLFVDVKNWSPEIQYQWHYLSARLTLDKLNTEQAKQISFGLSAQLKF